MDGGNAAKGTTVAPEAAAAAAAERIRASKQLLGEKTNLRQHERQASNVVRLTVARHSKHAVNVVEDFFVPPNSCLMNEALLPLPQLLVQPFPVKQCWSMPL